MTRREHFRDLIADTLGTINGLTVVNTTNARTKIFPNAIYFLHDEKFDAFTAEGRILTGAFSGVCKLDIYIAVKVSAGVDATSDLDSLIDAIEIAFNSATITDLENDDYVCQIMKIELVSVLPSIATGEQIAEAWFEGNIHYNQFPK